MSLKDLHLPLLDMMARVLAPGGVILSWTARSRGPGDRGLVEVSTVICPYGPPRRYWTAEGTEIDVFSRGLTYVINIYIYTYIQYIYIYIMFLYYILCILYIILYYIIYNIIYIYYASYFGMKTGGVLIHIQRCKWCSTPITWGPWSKWLTTKTQVLSYPRVFLMNIAMPCSVPSI